MVYTDGRDILVECTVCYFTTNWELFTRSIWWLDRSQGESREGRPPDRTLGVICDTAADSANDSTCRRRYTSF